ncbi:flagellar export chaperone FliS [Evansella sp. AB-P1]|uniref:flagellar export chaperone FliS n=1 Tax=Evansella sp. AB-P1 TaxID=3037653 RepID=UPI0024204639|nr:flagellar export chaperone FliS [Evansella sp. AB-P1]MDG5788648.1 flagellar export chaperone FliS [Evansella sp. AB-P1]
MKELISKEALHKKTPQEITSLLYEACLNNLEDAKDAIDQQNHVLANEKLQKSNDILVRLGAGINYEAGIIADQLDALYNYLAEKVIEANITKNEVIIEEVIQHIEALSSSWKDAMIKNKDSQPQLLKQKANAYEKNTLYEENQYEN